MERGAAWNGGHMERGWGRGWILTPRLILTGSAHSQHSICLQTPSPATPFLVYIQTPSFIKTALVLGTTGF